MGILGCRRHKRAHLHSAYNRVYQKEDAQIKSALDIRKIVYWVQILPIEKRKRFASVF